MASSGQNKGCNNLNKLRINSINKQADYETDNNFTIDLGDRAQQVKRISIVSAQFYNVFYNVYNTPKKFNNGFQVFISDGTFVSHQPYLIAPGRYTVYELMQLVKNAIESIGAFVVVMTISLNQNTNLVSVSLNITESGFVNLVGVQPYASQSAGQIQDDWIFGLLGWPRVNQSYAGTNKVTLWTGNPGMTVTAPYFPRMGGPTLAYITSSTLAPSASWDEKGSSSNILLAMDITVPWLDLQVFECKVDTLCELIYKTTRATNVIDIQLVDHEGDPLDLHGTPLNLELRVWTNTV